MKEFVECSLLSVELCELCELSFSPELRIVYQLIVEINERLSLRNSLNAPVISRTV